MISLTVDRARGSYVGSTARLSWLASGGFPLLDGDTLGQIAWLIDVATPTDRDVICEEL